MFQSINPNNTKYTQRTIIHATCEMIPVVTAKNNEPLGSTQPECASGGPAGGQTFEKFNKQVFML